MIHALYKKYILHSLAMAALCLMVVVCINLIVDPYDLFGTPKIKGFNMFKAVIASKQRVFETVRVLKNHDEAIILGTSRSDIGISPDHPVFPAGKTFNAAMSGEMISESRRILEELISRPGGGPKTVVIGLDFMAFNASMPFPFDYSDDNFSPWRTTQLMFSISGLLDSFRTIIRQDRYKILARGGILHEDGGREYISDPTVAARNRFLGSEDGYLRLTYKPAPVCTWNTTNTHGGNMYRDYRRLLELARGHNIDLKMFISPSHARQWETIAAAGLWEEFEQWKRQLVYMNAEVAQQYGHAPLPLWDFSGYNSITTTPVPESGVFNMSYYWESSHYHQEVGDMVLNRMFGIKSAEKPLYPADFGILLSEKNVDSWLKTTRNLREQYRKTHTRDVNEIAELAKKAAMDGPCAKK
jgi:hypothetical protein